MLTNQRMDTWNNLKKLQMFIRNAFINKEIQEKTSIFVHKKSGEKSWKPFTKGRVERVWHIYHSFFLPSFLQPWWFKSHKSHSYDWLTKQQLIESIAGAVAMIYDILLDHNFAMGRGSCAELAPGAVRSPPNLNIPPKTQIRVIGSPTYIGISGFCTTDCSMMSFYYLLLTMVACHRYHAPTILTTAHLSPGPPEILPRM